MNKIDRSYETLTSNLRFLKAINYVKPDRVLINYHSNPGAGLFLFIHICIVNI
jgi:hypothetical protein